MNGAGHFGVSIIITILMMKSLKEMNSNIKYFLIFVVNFLVHIVVDSLNDLTYHPSDADWGDPFYAGWHIFVYLLEFAVAIYLVRRDLRYVPGILGSVGLDMWDWSFGRFLDKYADIQLPILHNMADWVNENIFGWFPYLRLTKWAIIFELIMLTVLYFAWKSIRSNFELDAAPGSKKQVTILVLVFGLIRVMPFF